MIARINNISKIIYAYSDPDFPINVCSVQNIWGITHTPHWHENIEFIYQAAGSSIFKVGTKTIKLYEGQAILVNLGDFQSVLSTHGANGVFHRIVFDPTLLIYRSTPDTCIDSIIKPIIQREYIFPCFLEGHTPYEKDLIWHIANIVDLFKNKPIYYQMAIRSSIYHIFSKIILNNNLEKVTKKSIYLNEPKIGKLSSALKYMHINYYKKISDKDISSAVDMSTAHFCRFFKILIGYTPMEYLNIYRVKKAAELLCSSDKNALEAAFETGFESSSHFYETFKKYRRHTPAEYRRKYTIPKHQTLPPGWHGFSVGHYSGPGWIEYDDGTFTICGNDWDISNAGNGFHFAYMQVSGDCSVTCRVTSIENTHYWAMAGVMIRHSLDIDSTFEHLFITPSNHLVLQWRLETAKPYNSMDIGNITLPFYLKLIREGGNFTAHHSSDGSVWMMIDSPHAIKMDTCVYIGLAVTSHDSKVPCIGTFDNVNVSI